MADEKFEDKTLVKKEEEKIKTQTVSEDPKEEAKKAASEKVHAVPKPELQASSEKKKEKAEEKPKKPEFVLERKYVVNLSRAYAKPHEKRSNTALRLLKAFCLRHMKGKSVRVDPDVNEAIRLSIRPAKRISVVLKKDKDGLVQAFLAS